MIKKLTFFLDFFSLPTVERGNATCTEKSMTKKMLGKNMCNKLRKRMMIYPGGGASGGDAHDVVFVRTRARGKVTKFATHQDKKIASGKFELSARA